MHPSELAKAAMVLLREGDDGTNIGWREATDAVEALFVSAIREEREACAKEAERWTDGGYAAMAIRDRDHKETA